jgi:hypothetical protein
MINVVHPAYQAFPNGGHGSFAASGSLRFNCVLVFATITSIYQPGSVAGGPLAYNVQRVRLQVIRIVLKLR